MQMGKVERLLTWGKRILWVGLGFLVLSLGIFYGGFLYFFDEQKLVNTVTQSCSQLLNEEVTIRQGLKVKLLPRIKVQLNGLIVKNRVAVREVTLEIKMLPLLFKQVTVKELKIKDFTLALEEAEQKSGSPASLELEKLEAQVPDFKMERGMEKFLIKRLVFENGTIKKMRNQEEIGIIRGMTLILKGVRLKNYLGTERGTLLDLLSCDGNFSIASCHRAGKELFRQGTVSFHCKAGNLTLQEGSIILGEGRLTGKGYFPLRGESNFHLSVEDLPLVSLRDWVGDLPVLGKINMQVEWSGKALNKFSEGNYKGTFTITEGRYLATNIEREVVKGLDKHFKLMTKVALERHTPFTELTGVFHVQDHLLTLEQLSLSASSLRLEGTGIVDLKTKQCAIDLNVGLTALPKVKLPLSIEGNIYSPKVSLVDQLKELLSRDYLRSLQSA